MPYTASGLARQARCLRLGDIVFLPKPAALDTHRKLGAEIRRNGILPEVLPPEMQAVPDVMVLAALEPVYESHRLRHHREPSWARKLPLPALSHLRWAYAEGEGNDPLAINLRVPFTGLGYLVSDRGFTRDVVEAFGLFRLHNIRQLGYLHDPATGPEEDLRVGFNFSHTRYEHVLNVSAIATLIAANIRLPREEVRHLRAAALTHDTLTPAGGDTVKLVDREAFDEDLHYPEVFERHRQGWEVLRRKYGLRAAKLTAIVQNQGPLGRILDMADKLAYVARDADMYLARYHPAPGYIPPRGFGAAMKLTRSDPLICGWWDSVRLVEGNLAITDTERLVKFLKLRAYLFRDLYYNPSARFMEHAIVSVMVRHMYRKGELSRDDLLRMTDLDLGNLLDRTLGVGMFNFPLWPSDRARVETFRTRTEAERRERDVLAGDPARLSFIEEFAGATSSGAKLPVLWNGRVMPLYEAHQQAAEDIADILAVSEPVRLYYFSATELEESKYFRTALEHLRTGRLLEAAQAAANGK